jgi:hypothetical protein
VTRGVNDIDLEFVIRVALTAVLFEASSLPGGSGSSRGNGDTALLLLLHPVHGCRTVVDLTNLVGSSGVVKDSLGCCCLTGVNVRGNADVPNEVEWVATGHGFFSSLASFVVSFVM